MLSSTDLPGRTVHVVAPRRVDPRWPDPRRSSASGRHDLGRPAAGHRQSGVGHGLRPLERTGRHAAAHRPARPAAVGRAGPAQLPAPTRTGRWPGAVWVDARDDELWAAARTYATASLGTRVLDDDERPLAEFDDGGTVITAALTAAEVLTLRRTRPELPGRTRGPASTSGTPSGPGRGGEPQGPGSTGLGSTTSTPTRRRPAQPVGAGASGTPCGRCVHRRLTVATQVHDGREPARVVGHLGSGRTARPRTTDHLERIREGVFAIDLSAIAAGAFPDGGTASSAECCPRLVA